MFVEVGSWWSAPVLLLHCSLLAIEWVLMAFGWVSMWLFHDIFTLVVYVVSGFLKDTDWMGRAGLGTYGVDS